MTNREWLMNKIAELTDQEFCQSCFTRGGMMLSLSRVLVDFTDKGYHPWCDEQTFCGEKTCRGCLQEWLREEKKEDR